MEFLYKAKKSLDETVEGKIEADSLEQAIEQLARQGVVPVSILPQGQSRAFSAFPQSAGPSLGNWNLKKIILFTQKLYNLTRAGVELLSALRLLQMNTKDPAESFLLDDIIKNLKEGIPFSQCLSRYPQNFSFLYISIIRTGESTGQLKESFAQLLVYLQRLEDLKLKIQQALAYPIFMIVVGLGTIFVMLTFVLPRLVVMFADFQASLPWPTKALLAISDIFRRFWPVMIGLMIGLYFILDKYYGGRQKLMAQIRYKLPLVKTLVHKQAVANFSTSLSLLLKSGIPLLSALNIAAPVIANPEYVAQLEQVRQSIKEGSSFSQALTNCRIFPDFFIQMIKVGEAGGRLDSILADIAASYQQEIESDLKVISSLIEPAIILIMGLLIGGMVIAVLLPIFSISAIFGG